MATPKSDKDTPLCVDLDGTLINSDMLWESLVRLLKSNPLYLVCVLVWWTRGRARLKAEIATRVTVDPATLPYRQDLIEFCRAERCSGRKVLLVTASDGAMAELITHHLPIFDQALASDGKRNLRGKNKAATLAQLFGERGFDYAGNSRVDLPVWERSRKAIVVNGSPALQAMAERCAPLGPVFPPATKSLPELLRILSPGSLLQNLLVFIPFLAALTTSVHPAFSNAMLAFLGLLLCTGGADILKEWFSLDTDRLDPARKSRPFASGALKIQFGPVLGSLLILAGITLSVPVGWGLVVVMILFTIQQGINPRANPGKRQRGHLLFPIAASALRLLAGYVAVAA